MKIANTVGSLLEGSEMLTLAKTLTGKSKKPLRAGEVLLKAFMRPNNISLVALSKHLNLNTGTLSNIISGNRRIGEKIAWQLSQAFGVPPQFWLALEANSNLHKAKKDAGKVKPLKNIEIDKDFLV